MPVTAIIFSVPAEAPLAALADDLAQRCRDAGWPALVVPDLYASRDGDPIWDILGKIAGPWLLLSRLHPRPAHWVLHRHQLSDRLGHALALPQFSTADDAWAAIAAIVQTDTAEASSRWQPHAVSPELAPDHPPRPRWYPIVDLDRCIHCGHCLQFCLFGVYSQFDGRIEVANPDFCKSGCPACSRICPEGAIMFPLYGRDPAIAGAPGTVMQLDLAARRMFYQRTGRPCPACGAGRPPQPVIQDGHGFCPECGGLLPMPAPAPAPAPSDQPLPFDDLDDLVDQLDQRLRRDP